MMDLMAMSDPAVLEEIGTWIQRHRLDRNVTQAELASHAGVSRTLVQHLEGGRGCSLKGLVRIMRALELLPELAAVLRDPGPSPLQMARLEGRARRRASGSRGQGREED